MSNRYCLTSLKRKLSPVDKARKSKGKPLRITLIIYVIESQWIVQVSNNKHWRMGEYVLPHVITAKAQSGIRPVRRRVGQVLTC